jgi:hypothetical protein
MSIHNRYSDVPLIGEDFATFDAQFALIEEIIGALEEPDKLILRRVPKLGFKSDAFTRDALMLAAQHEELLPRGLDIQQLEAQMELRDALKSRALQMKRMARKMEMIVQLLGSDVFSGALAAYKSMKANHRGTMNEQLRELGQIFRNRKKAVEDQGPETWDEGQRQHETAEPPEEKRAVMERSERESSRRSDGAETASTEEPSRRPVRQMALDSPGKRSGADQVQQDQGALQHARNQGTQGAQMNGGVRAAPTRGSGSLARVV